MNTVRNKVQLTGNVGNTPEIRTFESGKKMARFSLATNESYRNAGGEWVNNTQWHTIVAWGKAAEKAEEQLGKGSYISVEGQLRNNSYVDKEGVKRYSTEVRIFNFEIVEKEVVAEP